MRFDISHITTYHYSEPVVLAPHILRLAPRPEYGPVTSHRLTVLPSPMTRNSSRDPQGNRITRLTFNAPTGSLRVESHLVQTVACPLPAPTALPPLPWPIHVAAPQAPLGGAAIHPSVRAYSDRLARAAGRDPLRFFDMLTRDLYDRTDRRIRHDGQANRAEDTLASGKGACRAEDTLASGKGACRDLTVLFMACARAQGVPARFVSGYQAAVESSDGQHHLHGWPEVWLGAGREATPLTGHWRGYDPTHGLAVGDSHLALAVAPSNRAP